MMDWNITLIMAEKPESGRTCPSLLLIELVRTDLGHYIDGSRQRPNETVYPLAQSLDMTVDTSCDRDDYNCVADTIFNYSEPGNVLVCWEHNALQNIAEALGDPNAPAFPSDK
jgi:hypothetical protein